MNKQIDIGTRVAYSRQFLQSCGLVTGWYPFARGTVVAINTLSRGCTIAAVSWDRDGAPAQVNIANLVREDRLHLERV